MEDARALAADLALRLAGAHDRDLDGLIVEALEILASRALAPRGYVTLFHDDGSFENSHEWTAAGVVPHSPVIRQLRSADFAYSYEMAKRGDVLAAPVVAELPDAADAERTSFSSFGVQSVLQVPIHVSDSFIGLVGINHLDPVEAWPDDYIDLVRRVGQAIGVVLVRQRAVAAAERAAAEAARSQRQRHELVGQVSHELLTPLHAVLGYAELLEIDSRSGEERDALAQIQVNGRHLLTLIEGLLVLSDAERTDETVDLVTVVDDTVDSLASIAGSRQVRLERVGDGTHPVVVDPVRCRQVLYCLLTGTIDAVGREGQISVEIGDDVSSPTIVVRAAGGRDLAEAEPVTPFTEALLEGYGRVVIERIGDDHLELVVRVDQDARP